MRPNNNLKITKAMIKGLGSPPIPAWLWKVVTEGITPFPKYIALVYAYLLSNGSLQEGELPSLATKCEELVINFWRCFDSLEELGLVTKQCVQCPEDLDNLDEPIIYRYFPLYNYDGSSRFEGGANIYDTFDAE